MSTLSPCTHNTHVSCSKIPVSETRDPVFRYFSTRLNSRGPTHPPSPLSIWASQYITQERHRATPCLVTTSNLTDRQFTQPNPIVANQIQVSKPNQLHMHGQHNNTGRNAIFTLSYQGLPNIKLSGRMENTK